MLGLFKHAVQVRSARVTGQDCGNPSSGYSTRRLWVVFDDDGTQLAHSVYFLFHGPADGAAVHQVELPRAGTQGIVLIPNGDTRNAIWIGSIYTGFANALTNDAVTPFDNYFGHWNGAYEYMDQIGNRTLWCPEGSYIKFGQNSTLPTIYRNISLGNKGLRQPFTTATRVASANVPTNFGLFVLMKSGASFNMTPSGAISVNSANSQTVTVSANGTTVQLDSSGNVLVTLASGKTFQLNGNGDALALVSKLVSAFNGHTHSGVTTGPGITGTPSTPWTASTVESAYAQAGG